QSGKAVCIRLNNGSELVQRPLRLLDVFLFEFSKALDLKLLFCARSPSELDLRHLVGAIAIAIQSDNRSRAFVDLLLVTMGRGLDLTALIPVLDRAHDAA